MVSPEKILQLYGAAQVRVNLLEEEIARLQKQIVELEKEKQDKPEDKPK